MATVTAGAGRLTNHPTIASAKVRSPAASAVCKFSTGNWRLVKIEAARRFAG